MPPALITRDISRGFGFPLQLALHTFSFIDEPATLLNAGCVNHHCHNLSTDESLWKRLCVLYHFDVEEDITHTPQAETSDASLDLLSDRRRGLDLTSSLSGTLLPFGPYHKLFKHWYLSLRRWRTGGTLLCRSRLSSASRELLNVHSLLAPPHDPITTSIALDSNWAVIGLADGLIHTFEAQSGIRCRSLTGHTSGLWCVVLVSGNGHPIDLGTDTPAECSPSPVPNQAFRRKLYEALGVEDAESDLTGGFPPHNPPQANDPASAAKGWGQPNTLVVSGGTDKDLRVWDIKSGHCMHILSGHTSTIRCLKILHGRPLAVSGSRDHTLRVWDIRHGRSLRVLHGHTDAVRNLDVYGNRVASCSYDHTCRVWDIDTGECLHVLRGHTHQIYAVSFDGARIATGGMDGTARIWNAESGMCLAVLQGHQSIICQVQLSPTLLVTGGSDGRVLVFPLRGLPDSSEIGPPSITPTQHLLESSNAITTLQLDSHFLVVGSTDARLYQLARPRGSDGLDTGRLSYVRDLCGPCDTVYKVVRTRDTCVMVYRQDRKTFVEVWSLKA